MHITLQLNTSRYKYRSESVSQIRNQSTIIASWNSEDCIQNV